MSEIARKTGRGFLIITGAKAWFMLTGAIISLGLPSFFATQEGQGSSAFGDWGVVVNMVSIFNMVMITGTIQAVSKVVSEAPTRAGSLVRKTLGIQLFIGVPIAVAYFLAAPLTASALNDSSLTPLLRISAGIILLYSFYAIFVGFFNGRKEFGRQAALDIGFATLKTLLIIGAVMAGLGVIGALGGFVATAAIVMVVSAVWVAKRLRVEPDEEGDREGAATGADKKRILGYMVAIMAYTFVLNAIIRADLFVLKALAGLRYEEMNLAVEQISQRSSSLSGLYTGMANVARLPYQGVIAITFVIFPIISRATFDGDGEGAKTYIRQSLRFSFMLVASMAIVVVANRIPLLKAIYPEEYGVGGDSLMWLCLGMVAFALMFVITTILISAGKPVHALGVVVVSLLVTTGFAFALIWTCEVGPEMLERAGLATMIGTSVGVVLSAIMVYRLFGSSIPLGTIARVVVAGGLIILLADLVPMELLADSLGGGRVVSLAVVGGKMAICGLLFYVLIAMLREFTAEDWARLRSVFRRRSSATEE